MKNKKSNGKNITQKIKEKIVGKKKPVKKVKSSDNSLEIKFKNVSFEIVGEDKLCKLSDLLSKGCDHKIIVTIPEYIFMDLEDVARRHLKSTGLDIFSYLHSDFLKHILMPYRGIKGRIGGRDFMIWKEHKVIVLAVQTK